MRGKEGRGGLWGGVGGMGRRMVGAWRLKWINEGSDTQARGSSGRGGGEVGWGGGWAWRVKLLLGLDITQVRGK